MSDLINLSDIFISVLTLPLCDVRVIIQEVDGNYVSALSRTAPGLQVLPEDAGITPIRAIMQDVAVQQCGRLRVPCGRNLESTFDSRMSGAQGTAPRDMLPLGVLTGGWGYGCLRDGSVKASTRQVRTVLPDACGGLGVSGECVPDVIPERQEGCGCEDSVVTCTEINPAERICGTQ